MARTDTASRLPGLLRGLALAAVLVFFLFPILWIFLMSFQTNDTILRIPPSLDPARAARVAGCSGAAFRVRLHRARRRVARQLAGDTADADADAALQPRVRQDTT